MGHRFSRRQFLRSTTAAGVTLWLPPLDIMFDGARAKAQTAKPIRMIFFYVGNGMRPRYWIPKKTGALPAITDATFPEAFKAPPLINADPDQVSLGDVKQYVRVMSGLGFNDLNGQSGEHISAAYSFVMGSIGTRDSNGNRDLKPSFDQIAAKYLKSPAGGFDSLYLGVCPIDSNGNYNTDSRNLLSIRLNEQNKIVQDKPFWNPQEVFKLIFGNFTPPTGDTAKAELDKKRQASILDGVLQDGNRLMGKLGTEDRRKLESHLDQVRQLELRVNTTAQCTIPTGPYTSTKYGTTVDHNSWPTLSKQMIDLVVMAMKCDQTRVVNLMLLQTLSGLKAPFIKFSSDAREQSTGASIGYHESTHTSDPFTYCDNKSDPKCVRDYELRKGGSCGYQLGPFDVHRHLVQWSTSQYAYPIKRLATEMEGSEPMINNTVVVYGSEYGQANDHNDRDVCLMLASGHPAIKGNTHYRGTNPGNGVSNTFLSVLQTMGAPVTSFGASSGTVPLDTMPATTDVPDVCKI